MGNSFDRIDNYCFDDGPGYCLSPPVHRELRRRRDVELHRRQEEERRRREAQQRLERAVREARRRHGFLLRGQRETGRVAGKA